MYFLIFKQFCLKGKVYQSQHFYIFFSLLKTLICLMLLIVNFLFQKVATKKTLNKLLKYLRVLNKNNINRK